MNYTNNSPPFSLDFAKISKGELARYFKWYMSLIPERIAILQTAVTSVSGFEDLVLDFKRESLARLGSWFAASCEREKLSLREREEIERSLKFSVDPSEYEYDLTIQTYSLALDVGMYFGETLLNEYPGLSWVQAKRKDADFGHAVVTPVGKSVANPTKICVVIARKNVEDKRLGGRELLRIYDLLAEYIPGRSERLAT